MKPVALLTGDAFAFWNVFALSRFDLCSFFLIDCGVIFSVNGDSVEHFLGQFVVLIIIALIDD